MRVALLWRVLRAGCQAVARAVGAKPEVEHCLERRACAKPFLRLGCLLFLLFVVCLLFVEVSPLEGESAHDAAHIGTEQRTHSAIRGVSTINWRSCREGRNLILEFPLLTSLVVPLKSSKSSGILC